MIKVKSTHEAVGNEEDIYIRRGLSSSSNVSARAPCSLMTHITPHLCGYSSSYNMKINVRFFLYGFSNCWHTPYYRKHKYIYCKCICFPTHYFCLVCFYMCNIISVLPFLEIFTLLGKTCSEQPWFWHLLRRSRMQAHGTINKLSSMFTPSFSVSESISSVQV